MEHHSTNSTYAIGGDGVGTSAVLSETATENIGKYGCMRREYLQEYQLLVGFLTREIIALAFPSAPTAWGDNAGLARRAGATKELKASAPL